MSLKSRKGHWDFKKNGFASYVRKLKLANNTVVLFKAGSIDKEGLEAFGEVVQRMEIRGITLLIVNDVTQVRALSEKEMNEAGWFRSEQMSKIVLDRAKEISKPKEGGEDDQSKPEGLQPGDAPESAE